MEVINKIRYIIAIVASSIASLAMLVGLEDTFLHYTHFSDEVVNYIAAVWMFGTAGALIFGGLVSVFRIALAAGSAGLGMGILGLVLGPLFLIYGLLFCLAFPIVPVIKSFREYGY